MNVMTVVKRLFLLLALLGLLVATSSSAGAVTGSTFVVNSTADTDDGACTTDAGGCTLREAINAANSDPVADTITFAIGTTGTGIDAFCTTTAPCTIVVGTAGLPMIQYPVTIDGWSQGGPGYTGPPLIVLQGSSSYGLRAVWPSTSGSLIRGLSIGGFAYGIAGNSSATALTIQGNYLGLKPDGTALPNQYGVSLSGGSGHTVGGSGSGEGNVISGNTHDGISLSGVTSSTIRGNKIGTKPDGATCLGNGNHGVSLGLLISGSTSASSSNTIGGVNLGEGNVIACNADTGVMVGGDGTIDGISNAVRGNAIWGNGGLGIDLVVGSTYGVTSNDAGDIDTGPNNLQNFPVLTGASSSGGNTTITGTLNSTAGATYTIDFYNNGACDSSGNGEGQKYLASTTTGTTDSNGDVTFSATFVDVAGVTLSQVTATATDSAGNTSEFSQCFAATRTPTTIYVNAANTAAGAKDGTSWAKAFTNLPDALAMGTVSGDQIWVAAGTYKPGTTGLTDARTATFRLSAGVAVYGGFAGGESSASARNWLSNATVLSGDLNGDDAGNFANRGDNAYHVVTIPDTVGSTGVLDGFTIRGGNANGAGSDQDRGGGLTTYGSPTLGALTITDNQASYLGGGVHSNGGTPSFTDVRFVGNNAGSNGGGMYSLGTDGGGSVVLKNVIFSGNSAPSSSGGGLFANQGTMTLTNVVFSGNHSATAGGMIWGSTGTPGSVTLANVTFSGNTDSGWNPALFVSAGTATMVNSIVWGNTAPSSVPQVASGAIYSGGGTINISYSDVQSGCATLAGADSGITCGLGNINSNPRFVTSVPTTAPTTGGDLHLSGGSPAIDAGKNSGVPSYVTTDLGGDPRFKNDLGTLDTGSGTPPIVDMGAYEFQGTTSLPIVTISSVSGSGATDSSAPFSIVTSTSPTIAWSADTSGSYAVKVGDCWSGTLAGGTSSNVSGAYTSSASVTSTVDWSVLGAGATVSVCVTDASANVGAASASIVVDRTPPTVTVASVSGSGGTDSSAPFSVATNSDPSIVWSVNESGNYEIKIGTSCTAGATPSSGNNLSGTYSGGSVTSTIGVASLDEGTSTVWVCANDVAANFNSASATIIKDTASPTVTINRATTQPDPTSSGPINFTIVFSEPVTGFATGDVALTGSAGATTANVTGSGTTYNVAASGMTGNGTVIATIAAGVAMDAAGNANLASTSTDNTVEYTPPAPPVISMDPSNQSVSAGGTATFTAAASGKPDPTVQWQVSTNGGKKWNDVSTATNTTYSFNALASQNGYQYRAVFTNPSGTATTHAAVLTVNGADLRLTAVDPIAVTAGQFKWTLTVTNDGPSSAQGTVLTVDLPNGMKVVNCTVPDYSIRGSKVLVRLGALASGANPSTDVVSLVVRATSPATLNASVTSSTPDPDLNNNSAHATVTFNLLQLSTLSSTAEPTATATASATPIPTATAPVTATTTAMPTQTPTPAPTGTPTPVATSTPTPAPTASPTLVPLPDPTPTAKPKK